MKEGIDYKLEKKQENGKEVVSLVMLKKDKSNKKQPKEELNK